MVRGAVSEQPSRPKRPPDLSFVATWIHYASEEPTTRSSAIRLVSLAPAPLGVEVPRLSEPAKSRCASDWRDGLTVRLRERLPVASLRRLGFCACASLGMDFEVELELKRRAIDPISA